jgi:hypothetical protein
MLPAAAVTRNAPWGPGEQRPPQQAALVGGCATGEATPRAPEALAARLVEPAAARARRTRDAVGAEAPRAQQGRRLASLGRTKPAVMAGRTADAARREPQPRHPVVVWLAGALGRWNLAPKRCREWRRVTGGLDRRPVVGSLGSAAHAWCGEGAKAGQRGGPPPLTARRRGRGGAVSGGWRQILTTRPRRRSGRATRAHVITCCHTHRRWRHADVYWAAGWPVGTGGVEAACGAGVTPRRAGEGKRWSLTGAEAMLALRSRTQSPDHDRRDSWRCRAHPVRARRYGRQRK